MAERYDETRTAKIAARGRMFHELSPPKVMMTLPGVEVACAKKLLELGVISPTTRMFWVERNTDRIREIRSQAKRLRLNPDIIADDVFNWSPPMKLDFVNLDLEEGFTPRLGSWLENLAGPNLRDGATLVVTLMQFSRNRKPAQFAKWFDAMILENDQLRRARDTILQKLNHYSEDLIRALLMTACALHGFQVTVVSAEYYSDGMPMMAFRIEVSRWSKKQARLPAFSELSRMFSEKYEPASWKVENRGSRTETENDPGLSEIVERLSKSELKRLQALVREKLGP